MRNIPRRRLTQGLQSIFLALTFMVETTPAAATTLLSTDLSDVARMSSAVVQAVVQKTDNVVDKDGVPWTIYSLAIEKVLAGRTTDQTLGIRCIGGTSGDRQMVMAGTPRLTVGDTIVTFLQQGTDNLCQVSALEYGVFWKRKDSSGNERLVDFRGRVIGAVGGDNFVFSADVLPPEQIPNVPETHTNNADSEGPPPPRDSLPPPALADGVLAELQAFCTAYVVNPETLLSVTDLTGIPQFRQDRAPTPVAQGGAK